MVHPGPAQAASDRCGAEATSSVEAFNPTQNRWEAVAPMSAKHDLGAVAAM